MKQMNMKKNAKKCGYVWFILPRCNAAVQQIAFVRKAGHKEGLTFFTLWDICLHCAIKHKELKEMPMQVLAPSGPNNRTLAAQKRNPQGIVFIVL